MRRAERVVDVHVGELGELPREVRRRSSSSAWKRRFSSSTTPAFRRPRDRLLGPSPTQSSANVTGVPSSSPRRSATGFSVNFGSGCPSGGRGATSGSPSRPASTQLRSSAATPLDAGVVGDLPGHERDVEVDADEHATTLQHGVEIADRFNVVKTRPDPAPSSAAPARRETCLSAVDIRSHPLRAMKLVRSSMRAEKPDSLSYQERTLTKLPSSTVV